MFYKDTPFFNAELMKWLVGYFISEGNGKNLRAICKEVVNFAQIRQIELINLVNSLMENNCVSEVKKPLYKAESKHVYKVITYESVYFITQNGKYWLSREWEIFSSSISKELYDKINHSSAEFPPLV